MPIKQILLADEDKLMKNIRILKLLGSMISDQPLSIGSDEATALSTSILESAFAMEDLFRKINSALYKNQTR